MTLKFHFFWSVWPLLRSTLCPVTVWPLLRSTLCQCPGRNWDLRHGWVVVGTEAAAAPYTDTGHPQPSRASHILDTASGKQLNISFQSFKTKQKKIALGLSWCLPNVHAIPMVSVKSVASSKGGLLVNDIHSTVSFVDLLFYFYWSWGSQRLWLHQYFYLLRCLSVRSQNQFISVLQSVQSSEWNGPHKDVIQWPHQNIDSLDGPHSSGTFLVTVKTFSWCLLPECTTCIK